MPSQIRRLPDTDSVQLSAPGDETTWTESLLFTYTDETIKNVWQVLADPIVPQQGQRYVPAAGLAGPTVALMKNFICRSIDASPVPQSPRAWMLRVKWSSRYPQSATRPYFNLTRSTSQRTVPMYRSGDLIFDQVPDNGTMPFPPTTWVSGTSVDMNGQPLAVKISQQSIQVDILWDRTRDRSTDAVSGAAASPDPPSEWSSIYVNTRNNASFLGWPTGYVTYLGWTANESPDETLVISHRFLADDWQHLEQRIAPNIGGKPLLSTGPTLVSISTQSAAYVYWYQPFVSLTNFESLFSWRANLVDAIKNPLPTYVA
jgi:hypothetical protein